MLLDKLSLTEFYDELASKSPAPGGGSVAALSAALAASLGSMVAELTIQKKGYEGVQDQMLSIAKQSKLLQERFIRAIDEDAQSFNDFLAASRLPKISNEDKQIRFKRMQEALQHACEVPYGVAQDAMTLFAIANELINKANRNASSDAAVCAIEARAAVLAAVLNARINLASVKDPLYVQEMEKKLNYLEAQANVLESEILKKSSLS